MKKSFILGVALCTYFVNTTKAQLVELQLHRVELGIRLMPTISNFDMKAYGGGTIKGQATFGFGMGGMLAINFTEHSSFQGEVLYNSLSQKYKDQNLERKIHVNYLNVPLLYCISTGKSKPVNLNFAIGPQLGFSMGSSITSSGGDGMDTIQTVIATKRNDFGFAYGTGLGFSLNTMRTMRLDLGYRGVFGLMNITKVSESTGSRNAVEYAAIRTNSAYVGFTLLF